MNRVLVIGATGLVGGQVVRQLLEAGVGVTALTRRPDDAGLPAAVEVVRGDLTDPGCLDGVPEVDAAFLVWCAPVTTVVPVVNRLTRLAGRVVFLSNMMVRDDVGTYDNRESMLHSTIERLISRGPGEWSFLRPGVFSNNARHWWAPQIRSGDLVRWPYGDARTAPIHERDIAAVAVRALLDGSHHRATYVLTGPDAQSHRDQVRVIGEVLGRPLLFEELSPEAASATVLAGWPATVREMLLAAWPRLVGTPVAITSTVADVTGTPSRSFRECLQDRAALFR